MILFKRYAEIKNFLRRFTIVKIGLLHIRIHKILDCDRSTLYHNHPFHYVSVILSGGYSENYITPSGQIVERHHTAPAVLLRKRERYHRITEIKGKAAVTLFIAYGNYGWRAFNTQETTEPDGVYQREVRGRLVWSKREQGIWFIGKPTPEEAKMETRHSIHQVL